MTGERLGVGLSYRWSLQADLVRHAGAVDWLEITPEHFLPSTPDAMARLSALKRRFPIAGHGLELSLGSGGEDGDAPGYRADVSRVLGAAGALWHSDHLCFTRAGERPVRALTPTPFTDEAVATFAGGVRAARGALGLPLLVENIAYYFANPASEMDEAEFINRVARASDCGLLLDLHNVLTNSINHRFDPYQFLARLPLERVVQIHIAGGDWVDDVYIDTHARPSPQEVLAMLDWVTPRCPVRAVNFEMDAGFPRFEVLAEELARARAVLARHGAQAA